MADLSNISTLDLRNELNGRFYYEDSDIKLAKKIVTNFSLAIKIEEWAGLYRFVINNKLTKIVEIGSLNHASSLAFLTALKHLGGGRLICVDIKFLNKEFEYNEPNIQFIRIEKSSTDVLPILNNDQDLSFIDGDHGTEQVILDIKNSLNIVKPNGYLIMHDANYKRVYRGIKHMFGNIPVINLSKPSKFHGVSIYKKPN